MERPPTSLTLPQGLTTDSKTEDYWGWVRQESKSNLYTLARGVVGFKDFVPHLHLKCCDFLQQFPWREGSPPESRKKLLKMSREFFKSSMGSVALPVFEIVHDPNITILLCSARRRNTRRWMTAIKSVIKKDLFQWVFPEVKPDYANWSKDEIMVQRDADAVPSGTPTITATSIDSGQASGHFRLVIDDDLIDEKTANSPTLIAEAVRRFQLHDALMDDWAESALVLIGTPWGLSDVIDYAEEKLVAKNHMMQMTVPCYDDAGESTFPERHPTWKLREIEETWSPFDFSCQWLVDPTDTRLTGFPADALAYYRTTGDFSLKCDCPQHKGHDHRLSEMVITAQVDPAFSDKEVNAETGIVVNALADCDCRFVLDVWSGHVLTERVFELIVEYVVKYVPFISGLGIEAVAGSRIYRGWLEYAQRHGLDLGNVQIVDLTPDTDVRKEVRMRGQALPMAEGLWHVKAGMTKFVQRIRKFPRIRPWDDIDAWAWCDRCWLEIGAQPAGIVKPTEPGGVDKNYIQQMLDEAAMIDRMSGYN